MPSNQIHPITILVNGAPLTLVERELLGRDILSRSGHNPPEDFSLFLLHGRGEKTPVGLEQPEHLHEHQQFAALFNGPTPVS